MSRIGTWNPVHFGACSAPTVTVPVCGVSLLVIPGLETGCMALMGVQKTGPARWFREHRGAFPSIAGLLAVAGLLAIAVVGVIKGIRSAELAVAALIVFQTGTIVLSMRVDFERYYLPILLGEVVAIGCCIGYLAWGVRELFMRSSPARGRVAPIAQPGR